MEWELCEGRMGEKDERASDECNGVVIVGGNVWEKCASIGMHIHTFSRDTCCAR